jgi:hypothetical protein
MNIGAKSPTDLMAEDLAKSGLTYQDLLARVLDDSAKATLKCSSNVKGYVIPYFNIYGKLTQYYRARLLEVGEAQPKYLQLSNTPNHVYFPKDWMETYKKIGQKFCILTEGEKKAALCNKLGIPAVAFGGVDSWRNRTIILPEQTEQFAMGKYLGIKLPSANIDEYAISPLALGMQELIDLGIRAKTIFIIIYDRDTPHGVSTGPQRAAARLGYELRFQGFTLNQIRQLIPPEKFTDRDGRATLEDILLSSEGGPQALLELIQENLQKRTTFPTHPLVREHLAKQLQKPKLDRKQMQSVALSLLTELDARGTRMYSPDDLQMYYFNSQDNHLMKVDINRPNLMSSQEGEFGILLYRDYSVSMTADIRLIQWLGSMFAGEQPVELVSPHRILAKPKENEDIVRFQINNGQYIKVTGDPKAPFTIMANGSDNTLFESQNNHSKGIDPNELTKELQRQFNLPLQCWWKEVLSEVRLRNPGKQGDLISYLYYISPYLLRWRGMQLPVEIITGEAGSGKSTLCEIRLNILTGDPKLRNTPNDQKDWYAAIANSGGLHITDNVQMTDKNLRQRISDELCRVVTEPDPRIQMRKYFTEADERSIKINAVFGFTAISAPFQNSDLLQRSISLELSKNIDPHSKVATTFDGGWKDKQIERFGGRTAWVAHQMIVLHKFLALARRKWSDKYQAKHRLVGFEQSLMLMAEVFGHDGSWIPGYLNETTNEAMSTNDWALQGLLEYADMQRSKLAALKKTKRDPTIEFHAGDIVNWASSHEDYEDCFQLKNGRSLGRYMQANKYNISVIAGIVETGEKHANRLTYTVVPVARKDPNGSK